MSMSSNLIRKNIAGCYSVGVNCCAMSKIPRDTLIECVNEVLKASKEKKRKFRETVELQVALKNYDPQKDKRFSGSVRYNQQQSIQHQIIFCSMPTLSSYVWILVGMSRKSFNINGEDFNPESLNDGKNFKQYFFLCLKFDLINDNE